jgi:hypothetical protein
MYLHSHTRSKTIVPPCDARLFIPESMEAWSADLLDQTFESGNLLSVQALEKFEIDNLEIWGVGDDVIACALNARNHFREQHETTCRELGPSSIHLFWFGTLSADLSRTTCFLI